MKSILNISEAFNLGLHSLVKMSKEPKRKFTIRNLSEELKVSEAHLSKVMQRLAKAGIISSVSGPKGGFFINGPISKITILKIYEIIEGKFPDGSCFLRIPVCINCRCVMGDLIEKINHDVHEYFAQTKLTDL